MGLICTVHFIVMLMDVSHVAPFLSRFLALMDVSQVASIFVMMVKVAVWFVNLDG